MEVEIKVLTPAFYSRFVHYARVMEAFDSEMHTRAENKTVSVSNSAVLAELFGTSLSEEEPYPGKETRSLPQLDGWGWKLVWALRCPPPEPSYEPDPGNGGKLDRKAIWASSLSSLDQFIAEKCTRVEGHIYRQSLVTLFLSQRIAFGESFILHIFDLLVRFLILYAFVAYFPHTRVPLLCGGPLWAFFKNAL